MDGEEPGEKRESEEPVPHRDRAWTRWLPSIFLVLAVLASASGVVYWLLDRPSSNAVEIFLVTPTPQPFPVAHVTGAVVSPGVYTLALNSRVGDAIAAAGGPLSSANVGALNLAARVVDGERIEVPVTLAVSLSGTIPGGAVLEIPPETFGNTPGDAAVVATVLPPTGTTAGLVNLNNAGRSELESLPGIGPARAQAIIDWRSLNGPFENLDALREVFGIGPETVSSLRGLVSW